MKPSIKPPPPINRQRQSNKKYKKPPIDWKEYLMHPWFKTGAMVLGALVFLSILVKFWPERAPMPDQATIAKVEAKAHAARKIEPVSTADEKSENDESIAVDVVERKARTIGYSKENLDQQFVAIVASMESLDSAIDMHQDLRKSEINSEIIQDYSKGKMWYRVVASRSTQKSFVERASKRYDFDTWQTTLTNRAKLIISYD